MYLQNADYLNHLFKTKELNLYVLGNHLIRMLTQLKNLI